MKTICALAVIFVASLSWGQITMSPMNAEYGKKAKGEFTLTNGSFAPLSVTLSTTSAMIKDGKFSIQGLAPTTHVKLS